MRAQPASRLDARLYQLLDELGTMATTPRHLREEIDRELLPALYARMELEGARAAVECAFWPAEEPNTWCVGDPQSPTRAPGGRAQAALVATWRAIALERPLCIDVAGGASEAAQRGARRMVRATAPSWARRHCPALVAAFGRIAIQDGRLQYTPGTSVRVRFASVSAPHFTSPATMT